MTQKRLDQVDRTILQSLAKAERKGEALPNLDELATDTNRSITAFWNRMQKLQSMNLVTPPAKKRQPRSRMATQKAKSMLQMEGELPWV